MPEYAPSYVTFGYWDPIYADGDASGLADQPYILQTNATLLEAVNIVAGSVGHPRQNDVVSNTDEAILRMAYYTNQACLDLLVRHPWQFLTRAFEINVIADGPGQIEKPFDLPSDFKCMIDDTHWNNSMQLPALGPINPQMWRTFVVRNQSSVTRMMWRIRGKQLWVKSPPVDTQKLSFEYISKYWAVDGDTGQLRESMVKNNDYHIFPWYLVVTLARAKWMENEGYDATGAYEDFKRQFDFETGTDKGAETLSIVPYSRFPYLDAMRNTPDSGYGLS